MLKTNKNPTFKYTKIALIASAFLTGSVYAQQSTGSVTGRVTGTEGIKPVEGAILRIEELGRETTSAPDGRYRFGSVKAGAYTLTVDYLGAGSKQYQITVEPGGTVTQMIALGFADGTEIIEVTGNFASINTARNMQRASDTVKDIIDSDVTGQFADQNIAESLQRLPGISINRNEGEGRFVTVRGLGPEFNAVSVNGVTVGSSSSQSRAIALDVIPSDLVETIEVSKTRTPDMDGESLGGSINIRALSAYDRGGRSFFAKLEGIQQDYDGGTTPGISARYTDFLDDEKKWGIALAASYSVRELRGDDLRNDNGLRLVRSFVDATTLEQIEDEDQRPQFYRPEEIDLRREQGERTRVGYTANIDYRPTERDQFFLRFTGSRLRDQDTRIQTEWELRDAGGTANENLLIQPTSGIVTDVDLDLQIFFQDSAERVNTFSIGGEHYRGDWVIDYQAAYSLSEFNNSGVRGRFRERDNAIQWDASDPLNPFVGPFLGDPSQSPLSSASSSDIRGDVTNLENMDFNQHLFIDDVGEDEITSFEINFEKDTELFSMPALIKFGAKHRSREKFNNRLEEFDVNPLIVEGISEQNLTAFPIVEIPTFGFQSEFNTFPEVDFFREYLWSNNDNARLLANPNILNQARAEFDATEEINALYGMVSFDATDEIKVIAGIRVEQTDWESGAFSTGRTTIGGDIEDFFLETLIPPTRQESSNDYTNVLPSLIIRYEPTDDIVIRASYTEAVQRPSFDNALPSEDFAIQLEGDNPDLSDLDLLNDLDAGNPLLNPAEAQQMDASIAWYPNETTYLSFGVFYKKIDNFFVNTQVQDAAQQAALGFSTPDFDVTNIETGEVTTFSGLPLNRLNITLNGDEATVEGIEVAYSQKMTFLPGYLSGLFVDANAAIINSVATLGEPRPDEDLPLPDQADGTANVSLGWENQTFSVRASWNWRDEILASINSNPVEDLIRESYEQLDINLRYQYSENIRVTFDIVNLNEERDERVFRGDENSGRLFNRIEDYGRIFRLGISGNF